MTKNILIVASKFPPEYSGPGVRIVRLYKHLKEQGHNFSVGVFCNGIEYHKNETYTYEDLEIRRVTERVFSPILRKIIAPLPKLKIFALYQFEFIKSFLILLINREYKQKNLIHIFGNSGGTAAALLFAKIYNIPVLMELVTALARPQQKIFGVFKISPHANSYVIALTKNTKTDSINTGFPQEKIWHRPNPINENIFQIESDKKQELRKELSPFHEKDIVLISVAKFMPQKNQMLIIEILKNLPANYKAIIAGPLIKEGNLYNRDVAYTNEIKNKIKEYQLENRAYLTFDFVEAPHYMKAGDIYLLPAWDEGFGTPMIEAMACGLPVIANKDEYAFQEWIKNGENGYLCDISNAKEWAKAIEKASQFSDIKKREFSKNIQEKAGQVTIYKQYEDLIKRLLGT